MESSHRTMPPATPNARLDPRAYEQSQLRLQFTPDRACLCHEEQGHDEHGK